MLWLDDHVLVCETPHALTIFDISVDPDRYEGHFRLKLDDQVLDQTMLEEPFSFGLGQNGKPNWYTPMFHSPLGAPASFAAVELSEVTEHGVQRLLERILPRMKPLGLDPATGTMLHYGASIEERMLDRKLYDLCFLDLPDSEHTLILKSKSDD